MDRAFSPPSFDVERAVPPLGQVGPDSNEAIRRAVFQIPVPPKARQRDVAQIRDRARVEGDFEIERMACWELAWTSSRLALSIAGDYARPPLEICDVFSAALMGLFRAAEKWDPAAGAFSTYGFQWARQSVTRYVADHSRLIRVPVHAHEQWLRARRFARLYEIVYGFLPEFDQRLAATDATDETLAAAEAASEPMFSWEDIVDFSKPDRAPDLRSRLYWSSVSTEDIDLTEHASLVEFRLHLRKALLQLDSKERLVVVKRFGLTGPPQTLEEIGRHVHLTRERIRQIEKSALEKVGIALRDSLGYPMREPEDELPRSIRTRQPVVPATDERTKYVLSLLRERSLRRARELRPMGFDVSWLGEMPVCFLLPEGWALRIFVTHRQLSGIPWNPPFEFGLALGLKPGETGKLQDPMLPGASIRISVTENHVEVDSLAPSLRKRGALPGDFAFAAVRPGKLTMILRRRTELSQSDPLGELLWRCGIDPGHVEARREPWSALTRALGGSGNTKSDATKRLLQRSQDDLLELIEKVGPEAARSGLTPGWHYRLPLISDSSLYAVKAEDALRVAVQSAPIAEGVEAGGYVWLEFDLQQDTGALLPGAAERRITLLNSSVVRWSRAEHEARRSALSGGSWSIQVRDSLFWIGPTSEPDLVAALESVTESTTQIAPPTSTTFTCVVPQSGFAIRRATSRMLRTSVAAIEADGDVGFRLLRKDGSTLTGFCLFELIVRQGSEG